VSPALSDLPVRKVIRALESVGFSYVRTKGSHAVYWDQDGRVTVIPQHGVVKRGYAGVHPAASGPEGLRWQRSVKDRERHVDRPQLWLWHAAQEHQGRA
jgi:predicted RNA binding protein YcfA (HicA-like mRNA interferase family)